MYQTTSDNGCVRSPSFLVSECQKLITRHSADTSFGMLISKARPRSNMSIEAAGTKNDIRAVQKTTSLLRADWSGAFIYLNHTTTDSRLCPPQSVKHQPIKVSLPRSFVFLDQGCPGLDVSSIAFKRQQTGCKVFDDQDSDDIRLVDAAVYNQQDKVLVLGLLPGTRR